MSATEEIPLAVVKQHNKPDDLWVIIQDKVYDLTKYRLEHPGGEDVLDEVAGRDGTKDFLAVNHSKDAREIMVKYCIGEVAQADKKSKLPVRQIGYAIGAVVIGFTTVFVIKRVLAGRS